jgi:hypothetical protein
MHFLYPFGQVDTILDKENFALEELDEDEIIQECKALNTQDLQICKPVNSFPSYYAFQHIF